jgi:lipopolysaccharide transport system ATP-binding protein
MAAVEALCQRVVWLKNGRIHKIGETSEIVPNYLHTTLQTTVEQIWDDPATAPGNEKFRLHRACVRPAHGDASGSINIRTPYVVEIEYWNLASETRLDLTLDLYNERNVTVFVHNTHLEREWHGRPQPRGLFRSTCAVPGDLMNDGEFRIDLVVMSEALAVYKHKELLTFTVLDAPEMRDTWHGRWPGAVRPNLQWKTELLTSRI